MDLIERVFLILGEGVDASEREEGSQCTDPDAAGEEPQGAGAEGESLLAS